jgi:hypothetical protein
MQMLAAVFGGIALVALAGCTAPPPAKTAKTTDLQEAPDVPTYCASKSKPCVPAVEFVDALCRKRFASVAPYLFQKHTPFVREYTKCKACEAVDLAGKPTGSALGFAEELLLLRVVTEMPDKPKQPLKETHELLRWDGTCVALPKRDVVAYLPGNPDATAVEFDDFDTTMRGALLRDKKVEAAHTARDTACKERNSAECARSSKMLSDQIIKAIRMGLRLPMPRERPAVSTSHE